MKVDPKLTFGVVLVSLVAGVIQAATYYVDASRPDDSGDGLSWATAKKTIQAAVYLAGDGDTVLVTNGVYDVGAHVVPESVLPNRVAITNTVLVRSVNGPAQTFIVGEGPLGTNAVRCVYITEGTLSGFTLSNGHTRTEWDLARDSLGGGAYALGGTLTNCILTGNSARDGGGAAYGTLYNCTLSGNWAGRYGGGASGATLYDCILFDNRAFLGGGASSSTLYNCTLFSNLADSWGGGAFMGTLHNCTLSRNRASDRGGGAYGGTLYNCTLSGNTAEAGGGAYGGALYNCVLSRNLAASVGGGAFMGTLHNCTLSANSAEGAGGAAYSTLYNCMLLGNLADFWGGGTYGGTLYNCTLSGNAAGIGGGGAYGGTLYNCIVYYNTAQERPNYDRSTLWYSCTTPLPEGDGNISAEPMFVDWVGENYRLAAGSPCINAGINAYALTNMAPYDLDGHPRIIGDRVDMGAHEYPYTGHGVHYAWLQQYRLPIDGSADSLDQDGDGMATWQEYIAGMDPINAVSVFRLSIEGGGSILSWPSVAGRVYAVEYATNLNAGGFRPLAGATNLPATPPRNTFTNVTWIGPMEFYRVTVRLE